MSEESARPTLGDEALSAIAERRRTRHVVIMGLLVAFVAVMAVAAIALVALTRQTTNVDNLAPALDAARAQTEYCARAVNPKLDSYCRAPIVPAAAQIIKGDTGPQGISGPPGPPGEQGPRGLPGDRGPQGLPGNSPRCLLEPSRCVGANGSTGKTGQSGLPGEPGLPGQNGKNGADGQPGEPGANGANGKDGQPGTPGADGKPGKPAYPFDFTFTSGTTTYHVNCQEAGTPCTVTSTTPSPAPLLGR